MPAQIINECEDRHEDEIEQLKHEPGASNTA